MAAISSSEKPLARRGMIVPGRVARAERLHRLGDPRRRLAGQTRHRRLDRGARRMTARARAGSRRRFGCAGVEGGHRDRSRSHLPHRHPSGGRDPPTAGQSSRSGSRPCRDDILLVPATRRQAARTRLRSRSPQAPFRSWFISGIVRMRLPVAAKIALSTAGAATAIVGSPTPPQKSPVGTMTVSTCGISSMRMTL